MATLDDIFKREFNQCRASLTSTNTIFDLNLQPKALPKDDFYNVRGIEVDYYSKLNTSNVMLVPRGVKLEKRMQGSDGGLRRKKDGSYFTIEVKVPKGSVAVVSNIAIGLPNRFSAEGYDYVDFIELKNPKGEVVGRRYTYILPRSVLYKVNFNALALSSRKMKSYQGVSIKSWNLGVLHLCIIPYKPKRTYANTVILVAKPSLDFSKEVEQLTLTLQNLGVISAPLDYITSEGENLGMSVIDPAYSSMEYISTELTPLSSLSEKDLESLLNGQETS